MQALIQEFLNRGSKLAAGYSTRVRGGDELMSGSHRAGWLNKMPTRFSRIDFRAIKVENKASAFAQYTHITPHSYLEPVKLHTPDLKSMSLS